MNDLKKIIAEAVKEIWKADRGDHGDDPTAEFIQAISPIIQATCEKALKQGGEDVITGAVVTDTILDNPGGGAAPLELQQEADTGERSSEMRGVNKRRRHLD